MRITQQMLVQSGIKLSKTENVDLSALVGKILHGKITGNLGESLALFSTGDMTLTVDLGSVKLSENQSVSIEISEFKDGAFLANIIKEPEAESSGNKLGTLLARLGVPDTPENRAILEAMKTSELPVTKILFSAFKQGMNEIKLLASELTKSEIPILNTQLDEPIKSIALGLIQKQPLVEGETSRPALIESSLTDLGQDMTTELKSDVSSHLPKSTVTGDNKMVAALLEAFESTIRTVQTDVERPSSLELKDAVITLLNQSDLKQEALIIKNELPITLKNLFVAYDLLEGKGTASRLLTVLDKLELVQLPPKAMVALVEVIASPKAQEEKLEMISSILSEAMPESEDKSTVLKELAVLKESVPFNKGLNDQMIIMQMPIPINNQIEHVELYYKRRKQSSEKDSFVILVALNTHHYGEVRCLIQKQGMDYTLNFSLEDVKSKEMFESKFELLKDALDKMDDKRFKVSFAVKDEKVLKWPERDMLDTFGFDLKV